MKRTIPADKARSMLSSRGLAMAAVLAAVWTAPVAADEPTPRAIFEAALAGEPFDDAAFTAAIERMRAAGKAPTLGLYDDHPIEPLGGPVHVSIPAEFGYGCDNKTFAMGIPADSFPDSREVYRIADEGDGIRRILLETTDPEGTLELGFLSDGTSVRLETLKGTMGTEAFDVARRTDGEGFVDAVSGDTFAETSGDIVVFGQIAQASVAAHPFWFADGRTLTSGDGFMQTALRNSIEPLVGAVAGSSGAGFEIGFLASVLSGQVTIDGVAYLLFEGGFTATVDNPAGPYDFTSTFAELYNAQTFVAHQTTQDLAIDLREASVQISNFISCKPL